jgi:hypothetical protein
MLGSLPRILMLVKGITKFEKRTPIKKPISENQAIEKLDISAKVAGIHILEQKETK